MGVRNWRLMRADEDDEDDGHDGKLSRGEEVALFIHIVSAFQRPPAPVETCLSYIAGARRSMSC